jgi:hypothetical protein
MRKTSDTPTEDILQTISQKLHKAAKIIKNKKNLSYRL